jgi:2,4-dienoyl-CoA reductase-like NADH-dependent reductase (Old Yellow Enzyme family)/thioredoxin reductase
MRQFPRLFTPIRLGNIELKNRFVVSPMCSELAHADGTVSHALIDYWEARAKGGWGLLIEGFTAIDPLGKAIDHQLGIWDDRFIPGLTELTKKVHEYDVKIAIQLGHAGRQTNRKITGGQPLAPSPVPCPVSREMPKELSASEIYEVIEKFGDAALRARDAGFDAIEVHGGHGYLVAEFMSAYSNKRTDYFGGKFENRMRFPVEIVKNIRHKIGNRFPVTFRLSADEKVPGGRTLAESCMVAQHMEKAGVNAINVSISVAESSQYTMSCTALPSGYLLPYAAEIKKSISIPVIVAGRINEPLLAEDAIETGKADLIGFGRPSLADPEIPNKVASGKVDEICPCIYCMVGCIWNPSKPENLKASVSCTVNPICGREGDLIIKPAAIIKKVVVVGGGPGGLESAWLAAARGYKVTLYEKEQLLGGQFRIAAIPPLKQDISKAVAYQIQMCEKYGVCFNLGIEATAERIFAERPDVVIIATGGVPYYPDVKGINREQVVQASEVIEGKKPTGNRVLIIGGGTVGCETADLLGEYKHRVTIVETLPEIASELHPAIKYFLFQRLKEYGVQTETGITVKEIIRDGVIAEKDGKEIQITGFDSIVLAMGVMPVYSLKKELEGKIAEIYLIGDALKPRQAIDAIREGAYTALKI